LVRLVLRIVPIIVLLGICPILKAQTPYGWRFDNIPERIGACFKTNPRLLFSFDSRRSFIRSGNVKIFGLRFGLEFDNLVRAGIGFYGLSTGTGIDWVRPTGDTIRNARLNFGYVSGFFEYVFFQNKKWELSVPLHLGIGETSLSNSDYPFLQPETRQSVLLTEISAQGQYKIFWLVGLGAGIGYRHMISPRTKVTKNFDAPIYLFKVRIFIGELFRRVAKKE